MTYYKVQENGIFSVLKDTYFDLILIEGCSLFPTAYLNHADYNMILVDWSQLAAPRLYASARSNAIGVANRTALLLNALADSKISAPKDQHIIGHSLGAHVAGLASAGANIKAGRCTGECRSLVYLGEKALIDLNILFRS